MRNHYFQQVKIVVIGRASSWDLIAQGSVSWEAAAQVEHTSHQKNVKRMRVVRYNGCDMMSYGPKKKTIKNRTMDSMFTESMIL